MFFRTLLTQLDQRLTFIMKFPREYTSSQTSMDIFWIYTICLAGTCNNDKHIKHFNNTDHPSTGQPNTINKFDSTMLNNVTRSRIHLAILLHIVQQSCLEFCGNYNTTSPPLSNYLQLSSLDVVCSLKLTAILKHCSQETVRFLQQILHLKTNIQTYFWAESRSSFTRNALQNMKFWIYSW